MLVLTSWERKSLKKQLLACCSKDRLNRRTAGRDYVIDNNDRLIGSKISFDQFK